jgi:hypothetical protein
MMANFGESLLTNHSMQRQNVYYEISTECSTATSAPMLQLRQFSTSSSNGSGGGIFNRIRGFFENRQEEKKLEKVKQRIEIMSTLPAWNLKAFADELDSALSDWTTKIPGMGNMKTIKGMKENKRIINIFMEELGEKAQLNDLVHMDRKQKV